MNTESCWRRGSIFDGFPFVSRPVEPEGVEHLDAKKVTRFHHAHLPVGLPDFDGLTAYASAQVALRNFRNEIEDLPITG